MEHTAVPIHFGAATLHKSPIGIDLTGTVSQRAGTPAPQPLPPLHGIAGHAEIPRNGLDALTALQSRQHCSHAVFSQHPTLRRWSRLPRRRY